jgi:hypothetical protein
MILRIGGMLLGSGDSDVIWLVPMQSTWKRAFSWGN